MKEPPDNVLMMNKQTNNQQRFIVNDCNSTKNKSKITILSYI